MDLKQKILSNTFVDQVRNGFIVDEAAFEELCSLLEQLAIEWKDKTEIDKELTQDLYIIPYVTKNMLEHLRTDEKNKEKADLIEQKWQKLDELVLNCFSA